MKKKKLKVTIIFTILMMLIITDVRAWYIPNKTSFAVGSIYDDNINTTIDANNAHIAYSSMGLSYAKKLNNPTMVGTTNSHANGTAYLFVCKYSVLSEKSVDSFPKNLVLFLILVKVSFTNKISIIS